MPASRRSRGATRRAATRRASTGLRSSLIALLNQHRDLNLARSFLSRIRLPSAPLEGATPEGPYLVAIHHNFPRKDASENYALAFTIADAFYDDDTAQPMLIVKAHKEGSTFTSADIEIGNRLVPRTYMSAFPEDLGHVAPIGSELSKALGTVFGLRF